MGPGFGDEIGRMMVSGLIFVAVVGFVVGATIAYFVPYIWNHISIGWN